MNIRDRVKELRRVPASSLRPSPFNWRTHPKAQLDALRGVLAEVGYAGAALARELADGSLELIDGHARAETCGDALVPVLVLDVTEAEAKKILATFDPLGAMAEADAGKLDALLKDVETSNAAVAEMLDALAHEHGVAEQAEPGGGGDEFDATPEGDGPTRAKAGELWVIGGKHRLLVGDNTDPANVSRLMGGANVGLCFTSPPYAQQRDYGDTAKEKVSDWDGLMRGTFGAMAEHVAPDVQILVNLGLVHREGEWLPYWDGWIAWMREQGWRRFGWYVWDQGNGLPGDWGGRFAPCHEFIWHFNRESVKPEKTVETKLGGQQKTGKGLRGQDGTVGEWNHVGRLVQPTKIPDSVVRVNRHSCFAEKIDHPAVFSVGLPAVFVECWPGLVYDPFLGSGTTLVAAHRLGRTCYGCELEPKYADVILRRAEAEGLTCERAE